MERKKTLKTKTCKTRWKFHSGIEERQKCKNIWLKKKRNQENRRQARRAFQKTELWRVLWRQEWKVKWNVGNKPVLPQLILSPSIRIWSSVSASVKPTGTAAAPATTEALRVPNTLHGSATAASLLATDGFPSVRAGNEEGLSTSRAGFWKYQVQNNARTEKLAPVIWIWEPRQWKALTLIFVLQLPLFPVKQK